MGKRIRNKVRNISTAFRLAQRLMKGSRRQLYFLLAIVMLFNIEVPLMMPLILKSGFRAVAENDMGALLRTAAGGICAFAVNFAVMYFVNVYGDAWVTKFAFHAAGNSFRELGGLPVASIQAVHNDDDLFNRIAAGTGNIMGFYFSMVHLLGNGVAVIVLTVMLCLFSKVLGGFVILLVAAEFFVVRLQLRYNAAYTEKLQRDKAESIRKVRSLLEQMSFHHHNQTWDWMEKSYERARKQWFDTQERKVLTNALLDSCLTSVHGLFKAGLIYGFMVREETFSSYADDVAASFSTFSNLVEKAKSFGGSVSQLPNFFVPIGKLNDILTGKPKPTEAVDSDNLILEQVSVMIGDRQILRNVCCRIPLGSRVAVIGENGSGKSTFLKAIAGLYECQGEKVYCLRRRAAYIPANELLFEGHTVAENISYGSRETKGGTLMELLEELCFRDREELCGKVPAQLSGGEAKRINIARGLVGDAEVILADEPTSSLDRETAVRVMEKILSLKDKTVLYITHDPTFARLADEIIYMRDGEILQMIGKGEFERNALFETWSCFATQP